MSLVRGGRDLGPTRPSPGITPTARSALKMIACLVMHADWWGRKVARLPDQGTLLFATDLQGNFDDYERMKTIYAEEEAAGNDPVLLFAGDLVHGPARTMADPAVWPDYLGSFYEDRSAEIILDFADFTSRARALSLLGNHEHAHIGGPVVSKFHDDEAAVLDARLGPHRDRIRSFLRTFPLLAVARCGARFTHGAPRVTEPDLDAFERLDYEGYETRCIQSMIEQGTVGGLLWSRYAEPERARAFLAATALDSGASGFVAFGHDVVREGFDKVGHEQICISTSFGCHDHNKYYLRLDLAARYRSVHDLRIGKELRTLHS
jgi:hypothetical protein